jgi:CRP-like cAMP-binding protein
MSIEADITLLQSVPTLALLGRDPLRILAIGAESKFIEGGQILFRAGDPADAGYVVQEGSFRLVLDGAADDESAIIVGPGTLLGEIALITETKRPQTATAAEASSVIRIARPLFLKMLEGYPDLAYRLRNSIAARTTQMIGEIASVRRMLHHEEDAALKPAVAAKTEPVPVTEKVAQESIGEKAGDEGPNVVPAKAGTQ